MQALPYRLIHLFGLAISHSEPPSLVVQAVGARDELPECSATREPGFDVELLGGSIVQSA